MSAESLATLRQEWRSHRIPYERLLGQFAQHLLAASYVVPLHSQQLATQTEQIETLELAVQELTDRLVIAQGGEVIC